MEIIPFVYQTEDELLSNTYIFVDAHKDCVVIDPSKDYDGIVNYIKDHLGFENLPEGLEEVALLRLSHPDSSLIELTKLLGSPIGKSGMNHRLKKLSLIAEELRAKQS